MTTTETLILPDDPRYLDIDYDYRKVSPEETKRIRDQQQIVWYNVGLFAFLHIVALVGLYEFIFVCQWKTVAFTCLMYMFSGLGITMGAHRLWAHRSFKAKTPLKIFLMLCNCTSAQNDIIEWSRDHRGHHKWTETDADPHNADRGFFFTHVGWLLMKKHPAVIEKGKTLLIDDIINDPVCAFQRKYYKPLTILFTFILPTVIPWLMWNESAVTAYLVPGVFRYVFMLNATWCVNSVAHTFGDRPYDVNIAPAESVWTSFFALGEGWHNYHHSFPFDYKTAEMPYMFNFTTLCIDIAAAMGQAYDLKSASDTMIASKIARTGHKGSKQG